MSRRVAAARRPRPGTPSAPGTSPRPPRSPPRAAPQRPAPRSALQLAPPRRPQGPARPERDHLRVHDADPLEDRVGTLLLALTGRRAIDLEAKRGAVADDHLGQPAPPPVARLMRAEDRHRHDGRAALQGEAPDPGPGGRRQLAGAGATALA